MHDVASQVRHNLKSFYTPIEMPGGYMFNHVKTLKYIDLYYNSQFESGEYDEQGYRKYFLNIVKQPCDVASKFIDLDTKDIILTSKPGGIEHKMWLMQRDLKDWLSESGFAKFLNQSGEEYPKYGTVVAKRTRNGAWDGVHIQNVRTDTRTDCLRDSGFVYEAHMMSRWEVEDMKSWNADAVAELLETNPSQTQFIIYEAYHRVSSKKWERSFLTNFLNVKDKESGQYLPVAESQIDPNGEYMAGNELFMDEVNDIPYREMHWERVPGRWLSRGFVEYLLDNQMSTNDLSLGKRRSMRVSSTPLFWTTDETIGRNVLSDLEPGQIIKGQITPVDTQERNLATFQTEEDRWEKNRQEKTFSFEAVTGKNLPSQTPLGVVENAVNMIESYFDKKRENFGLFVKEILTTDVIPAFKNDKRKSHILKFMHSDSDMDKLRRAVTDHTMRTAFWKYAERTGTIPSRMSLELERVRLEGAMKKRKDLAFELPDDFYDDVDELVDVVVTDESVDVQQRLQTLQKVFETMSTNPTVMDNPLTRTVFVKMLELAGVSAVDLDLVKSDMDASQGLGAPQQTPQAMLPGQQPQNAAQPAPVAQKQPVAA